MFGAGASPESILTEISEGAAVEQDRDVGGVMEGLGVECGRMSFSKSSIGYHNDAMGALIFRRAPGISRGTSLAAYVWTG